MKFIKNEPLTIEENRQYEFKEIKGNNPIDSIKNNADEYVVAFLNVPNGHGGSIYWGIENNTRKCVGITLTAQERDNIRKNVVHQLSQITPPLTPNSYNINFHHVYDSNDEAISYLWIVQQKHSKMMTISRIRILHIQKVCSPDEIRGANGLEMM